MTRFRVHIGHCVACGTRVQGRHPSQTSEAAAQVGPEALAFAAILNQEFGLSYGKTVAVRQRGFGLTLTPGGLSQALARLAARCEPPDEHRKAVVRTQPSVTLDETGWRIGGHPAWLHVAATADATVYGIFAGRGFDAAAALIGADYDGCLVRDGWAPYRRFEGGVSPDLHPASDQPVRRAHPASHPRRGGVPGTRPLRGGHRVGPRAGPWRPGAWTRSWPGLLDRRSRLPDHRRLAHHLSRECDALFTCLRCPGLEATHYRGEHAIRPAVVTRTVWGGHRTATGAHTQEVLTSVLRTWHQHDNDPVPYLVALLRSPQPYVLDLDPSRASPH